jgi:predicted dehydrogenase
MNRRELLTGAILTAASAAKVARANDRVRVGLIGCGGRGRYVAGFMSKAPGAEFVAFCDVYQPNAEKARAALGPGGATYTDLRKLLERADVDAVLVATPDHWHANATVAACQAGKDVYVEKPVSYSIREGRAMVRAAREHNRIVQAGTQHRSAPHFAECARMVQSGELGEVHLVRVWNYMSLYPKGFGRPADTDAPAGLDWDRYSGPAPLRAYNPMRFQSTFRWFWDYANGLITDYGTHRFDTVHQIMGEDKPRTIAATGRRFAQRDLGEMPDTMQVTYEYPSFVMSYECSTLNSFGLGGRATDEKIYYHARTPFDHPHGMAFYGTNGTLVAERTGYEIFPEPVEETATSFPVPSAYRMERRVVPATDAVAAHAQVFIENVRGRKKPFADIEVGHRGTTIGLLGNIAYKTGLKLRWDAEREDFANQPEASALLWREPRKPYDWIRPASPQG